MFRPWQLSPLANSRGQRGPVRSCNVSMACSPQPRGQSCGPSVALRRRCEILEMTPHVSPVYVSYLRLPRAGPVTALVAMMLGYIAVFGTLTYQQQSNYGTYGFDMGIYDQGIWLVSHFKSPFVTIRGLDYFGHHVNIITLLFVPAYWLGAGPHFLYAVETVWLAAGAIPIWLLGRDRLESSWMPLGLCAAYLLYPCGGMDQPVAVPSRRARSSLR